MEEAKDEKHESLVGKSGVPCIMEILGYERSKGFSNQKYLLMN